MLAPKPTAWELLMRDVQQAQSTGVWNGPVPASLVMQYITAGSGGPNGAPVPLVIRVRPV